MGHDRVGLGQFLRWARHSEGKRWHRDGKMMAKERVSEVRETRTYIEKLLNERTKMRERERERVSV